MRTRVWIGASFATCTVLLAACSPEAKDFSAAAEKFIESDEITAQAGTTYTDASCEKPSDVKVGTVFHCTATGADGAAWTFDVTIRANDDFEVIGRLDG